MKAGRGLSKMRVPLGLLSSAYALAAFKLLGHASFAAMNAATTRLSEGQPSFRPSASWCLFRSPCTEAVTTRFSASVGALLGSTCTETPLFHVLLNFGWCFGFTNPPAGAQECARELKSVHVNVPAFYIRLVVQRCHVNKLNIYNQ
eukprot:1159584-Pelagomonas_calceolata.AAC.1